MSFSFTKMVFMVMEFSLLPSNPRPSCLAQGVTTMGLKILVSSFLALVHHIPFSLEF
jgi:hypothetical protein